MALPDTRSKPTFNTKSPTIKRILQESRELSLNPDPSLTAAPLETNLFEWHFTITGPPSTPYAQGIYHGRIILPPSYPLRPPSFRFLTPSGRFEINREICLSISGHHEETWQPAWGIRTALCAIRAFMAGDAKGQVGGLNMDSASRESLARASRSWKCGGCLGRSNEDLIKECEERWRETHKDKDYKEAAIPDDLRLAFREDLEKPDATKKAINPQNVQTALESSFTVSDKNPASPKFKQDPKQVPTVSEGAIALNLPSSSPSSSSPEGTRALSSPSGIAAVPQRVQAPRPQHGALVQEPVPRWLDKAILGLIVTLMFMLIKKLIEWSDS